MAKEKKNLEHDMLEYTKMLFHNSEEHENLQLVCTALNVIEDDDIRFFSALSALGATILAGDPECIDERVDFVRNYLPTIVSKLKQ